MWQSTVCMDDVIASRLAQPEVDFTCLRLCHIHAAPIARIGGKCSPCFAAVCQILDSEVEMLRTEVVFNKNKIVLDHQDLAAANHMFRNCPSFLVVLWVDEILHHLRNPGMMIPRQIPTNNGFPWFQRVQSGAELCPFTVYGRGGASPVPARSSPLRQEALSTAG